MSNKLDHKLPSPHIRFIDGVRALAITLVLLYHFFPEYAKGGFLGVDIFFVISGFLITKIICENNNNEFSFIRFYENRLIRLVPALLVIIFFSVLLGWFALLPLEYKALSKQIISSVLFVSNFLFLQEAGYFDISSQNKPLLHLWSLAVEMQLYMIWPVILVMVRRLKFDTAKAILVLIIGSFSLNILLNENHAVINFYNPFSRLWEFLFGGFLFSVGHGKNPVNFQLASHPKLKTIAPWVGLTSIVLTATAIDAQDSGWLALIPVLGTLLIIYAGGQRWLTQKIFSNNFSVWVGVISYPLYLWHWVVLYFLNTFLHGKLDVQTKLLGLITSIALAWVTHIGIEKPIQANRNLWVKGLLVFQLLLVFVVSLTVYFGNGLPNRISQEIANFELAAIDWAHPESLDPFSFEGQTYYVKKTGAHNTTVFVGDSSLEQYTPRINEVIKVRGQEVSNVLFFTRGGCSPIPSVNANYGHEPCDAPVHALKYLSLDPQIDTVVIGGAWPIYFSDQFNYRYKDSTDYKSTAVGNNGYQIALSNLAARIQQFKRPHLKVYLALYTPFGKQLDPYALIDRNLGKYPHVFNLPDHTLDMKGIYAQLNYSVVEKDLRAMAKDLDVEIIDPFLYLCTAGQCATQTEEHQAIYKDQGHMSASFARKHATFIDRTILK